MGYTHFKETHEGRKAQVDYRFQRTYERSYKIRTNNPTYGPGYVGSHPSLPVLWSSHPEDSAAYVHSIIPVADPSDPCLWNVSVLYQYLTVPGESIPNPLLRPPDYEIDGMTWRESVWMDRYGQMITNSAGDPFLPPVETVRAGATFITEFNMPDAPDSTWIDAQGCLNATAMLFGPYTVAAERLQLEKVRSKRIWELATPHWRWTLIFTYKPYVAGTWRQAHKTVLLDQGRRELISGTRVPIVDPGTGIPVDQPMPLNGSGRKLAVGATPTWLVFDVPYTVVFPDL